MAALLACAALALAAPAQAAGKRLPGEKPGVTQYKMQCTPQRAKAGDTLTIRFPAKHGGDFSVGSPKDELFSVAFKQPDRASSYQPLIGEDAFARCRSSPSRSRLFRVFRPTNRDPGALEGWCKVRFTK